MFLRTITRNQNLMNVLIKLFLGVLLPLLIFGEIAEDLLEKERFAFETPFLLALHANATPATDRLALLISTVGGASIIAPVSLLILAVLWMYQRRSALFFGVAVAGAALMNLLLKFAFQRPRPELWPRLVHETDASFPSGHSMYSAAFVTAIILLLWHTRYRYLALVLGVFFSFSVGWSRLYLGVHYPTDVLCGWLAGFSWVMGTRLLIPRPPQESPVNSQLQDV